MSEPTKISALIVTLHPVRWYKIVRGALIVAALATLVAAGINWLSHQNWGTPGETFSCDPGQTLQWHNVNPNEVVVSCVTGG